MRKSKAVVEEQNIKVMVIDDDSVIVDGLTAFLRKNGYECIGYTDTMTAMDVLNHEKVDLLILDYMLLDTDAKKIIDEIRTSSGCNKDTFIILLTGFAELAPPLESVRELDIQGYVEKSSEYNDVLIEVEKIKKIILKLRNYNIVLKKSFGEKLKELRTNSGMTQEDLANILGVARTTIVAYEQNVNEPSIATLKKLAEINRVSIDFLLNFSVDGVE